MFKGNNVLIVTYFHNYCESLKRGFTFSATPPPPPLCLCLNIKYFDGQRRDFCLVTTRAALYGHAHYDHIVQSVSTYLQNEVIFVIKTLFFLLYLFSPFLVKVILYVVFVIVADTHSLPVSLY